MAFTNNRLDFYNNRTYEELSHAQALAKGIPNFVNKGLELTGTTLTSGIFSNGGTFGQLGNEGETYDITANYTGYVIIKSTLNGNASTSVIELDTTRKDTDPRDTGNIKYFTIYKLNAGVIAENYRHSNYIKDISFENVGGSNFVQLINGTKSNPFDASTFAGNRTSLDDKDINYDDTIHVVTLLEDDLKEIRDNAIALVGNDKPLEVSFHCDSAENEIQYNPNLYSKIETLIINKQGIPNLNNESFEFTMKCFTGNGILENNNENSTKIIIDGNRNSFYYEFVFDYDNFANVVVMHTQKYIQKYPVVLKSNWDPSTNITLDGGYSIYDFESISITETNGFFRMGSWENTGNSVENTNIAFGGTACGSTGVLYTRAFNITVSNGGKNFSKTGANTSMAYGSQAAPGSTFGANAAIITPTINYVIWGHGCKSKGANAPLSLNAFIETPNIEPEIDNPDRIL